ncbi:hypothetical protein BU26DRAFT_422735 [Trematosphaeria pertusa]|uniref:Transcription factor domain-containing protein n=1 Tax=Trematosphaeria pertusa TaxID=390896 RepID=A0A6A6IQX1_9PLEO|nr:uncharacterized protein BU26DRAFT_422735 [Trematosphaeria pertusa]KAF2252478.1 hypothetical protein BU26DRAFT_422735 [Trematosphaeria pertusa]
MDRGDLQREQARYKTQVIAQNKSAMRENEFPGTSQNVGHEIDTLVTGTVATSSHPPAHPTRETLLRGGLAPGSNLQLLGRDGDLHTSSEPIWGEALYQTDFSTQPFYNQTVRISSHDQSSSNASRTRATSISTVIGESNLRHSIDIPRSSSSSEANMDGIDLFCDTMLSEYCASELSGYSSEADRSICAPRTSRSASTDFVPQSAGPSNPILHGDVEDILFMYYLDHVFYKHCPFYFPFNREGRGWLLSILKRVNSAYHAALALSEYHHSTSTQHGSGYYVRTRGGHYDLAVEELKTSLARSSAWSGNLGLAHNVEVLTTILHLLFYEVRSCSFLVHVVAANTTGRYTFGARMPYFHRLCKHRWGQLQQDKAKQKNTWTE